MFDRQNSQINAEFPACFSNFTDEASETYSFARLFKPHWAGQRVFLGGVVLCLFLTPFLTKSLQAETSTWTGSGDGQSWADPDNWTNGVPNDDTDQANFVAPATANGTIDLGPSVFGNRVQLNQLRFQLSDDLTLTNSIPGGILELHGEDSGVVNSLLADSPTDDGVTHTLTIENDIEIFKEVNWINASPWGDRIAITGDITSGNTSGLTILRLTGRNVGVPGAAIEIHGNISDGDGDRVRVDTGWAGDGARHQNVVRLTGDNTFTGGINVFTNTLEFDSVGDTGVASALGSGDAEDPAADQIDIGQNSYTGTLRYIGTEAAGHATNRDINLFGTTGGARIEANGLGPLTLNGDVLANNGTTKTLTLAGSNTGSINGTIHDLSGGSVNVRKEGPGKWTLSGENLYAGSTVVVGGELELTGRLGTDTYSGGLLAVSSTLTIDGANIKATDLNQTASSTLNFRSGRLELTDNESGETHAGSIDIGTVGVGELVLSGGDQQFRSVSLNGPDDALDFRGGSYAFESLDNSAGGTIAGTANTTVSITGRFTHNVPSGAQTFAPKLAGDGGLTKRGNGTLRLTAEHSYNGLTHVQAGTLELDSTANLDNDSPVRVDAGATLDMSRVSNGDEIGPLAGGGLVINGIGSDIAIDTASTSVDFSGSIQGGGRIIKRGLGTQTLSGPNTYTGFTNLENGTLRIAEGGSVAGTSGVGYTNSEFLVDGGSVETSGNLRPNGANAKLTVRSGTLKAAQIDRSWSTQYLDSFAWSGGTVHLTSETRIGGPEVDIEDRPFQDSLSLAPGMNLVVDEDLQLQGGGELNLQGGTVRAKDMVISPSAKLNFASGTIRIDSDQDLTAERLAAFDLQSPIGEGRTFAVTGQATIASPITILSGGTFTATTMVQPENLVLAGGQLNLTGGNLVINADRAVDATTGTEINIARGLRNNGKLNLIGAAASFQTNSTNTAEINAINSMLTFDEGLINQGNLNLINSDVVGPLTNEASISIAGAAHFQGAVASRGNFLGDGTAYFQNGFSVAGSPAAVEFEGNVEFDETNSLGLNLAGASPNEFDRLFVTGDASLGGSLEINLLEGFVPSASDTFAVLDAANLDGAFANVAPGSRVATAGGEGTFLVDYGTTSSFDANQLVFSDFELLMGLFGDFNNDGQLDDGDIDLLSFAVGGSDIAFDLTDDGIVDGADRTYWVEELRDTHFGDADLNGSVDFADFLTLSTSFGQQGGWAAGDFDGDNSVAFGDFLLLSSNFGQSTSQVTSVPEPAASGLFGIAMLAWITFRRDRRSN